MADGEEDAADLPDDRTYAGQSLSAAYELVGNEVRAAILLALSRTRGGQGEPPVLPFSALRSRVDVETDSSQFNYHLQRLVGTFVEDRSAGDAQLVDGFVDTEPDGYALRPEGSLFTRSLRASIAGETATPSGVASPLSCHYCGATVELTYRNAIFALQCPDCEYLYEYDLVPPGVLHGPDDHSEGVGRGSAVVDDDADDETPRRREPLRTAPRRTETAVGEDAAPSGEDDAHPDATGAATADDVDPRAVYERAATYLRERRRSFAGGVCPTCGGGTTTATVDAADSAYPRTDRRELFVNRSCVHCGDRNYLRLGELLQRESAVVAFCHETGLALDDTPPWELAWLVTDTGVTVDDGDPWRAHLAIERDGERLVVTVDDAGEVVETRRA